MFINVVMKVKSGYRRRKVVFINVVTKVKSEKGGVHKCYNEGKIRERWCS